MTTLHLFDLDGVLADDRHRLPHILDAQGNKRPDRNYSAYFDAIPGDSVWPQGANLYEHIKGLGEDFGYLTGRTARRGCRENTLAWLEEQGFATGWDHPLIMRRENRDTSYRLAAFKVEVIRDLLFSDQSYDEVILYDDDPAVISAVNSTFANRVNMRASAIHCTWHVKAASMVGAGKI